MWRVSDRVLGALSDARRLIAGRVAIRYAFAVPDHPAPEIPTHSALPHDLLSSYLAELRFVVSRFGHQHDDPTAEADPRVLGDVEVIYFCGGRGRVISSGAEYACRRGDLVIIPPFQVHEIRTTRDDPHENYWVHFDVAPLYERERLVSLLCACGYHLRRADEDPLTAHALALLAAAVEQGTAAKQGGAGISAVIEGAIRALVAAVGSGADLASILSQPVLSGHDRTVLDRVLSWVAANLKNSIEVEDLVDVAACSRTLLFRLFQEQLGRSPMAMVRWIRLREAERLLRSTTGSVKEISAQVGIASPFHLSRLVKELYGVSPQQLRTQGHAEWTP